MIAVICPSRGNPRAAWLAYESFVATSADHTSTFVVAVDTDDPKIIEYCDLFDTVDDVQLVFASGGSMVIALNEAVEAVQAMELGDIIGFIGDDHRFRTHGWDRAINVALRVSPGFLYADDLAQRANLPTQVFINSKILSALGWMAMPTAKHLYIDNVWKELGERADCLYYAPQIIIEHLHPAYGKGEWDENHKRVNSQEMYDHDAAAFGLWMANDMEGDVARVRECLTNS